MQTAGTLKQGSLVCLDGRPCKIVSASHSQPGKHGSTKVRLIGKDVFHPQKRLETIVPTHAMIEVPNIIKVEALLRAVELKSKSGVSVPLLAVSFVCPQRIEYKGVIPCASDSIDERLRAVLNKDGDDKEEFLLLSVWRFGRDQIIAAVRPGVDSMVRKTYLDPLEETQTPTDGHPLSKKAQRALKKAQKKKKQTDKD